MVTPRTQYQWISLVLYKSILILCKTTSSIAHRFSSTFHNSLDRQQSFLSFGCSCWSLPPSSPSTFPFPSVQTSDSVSGVAISAHSTGQFRQLACRVTANVRCGVLKKCRIVTELFISWKFICQWIRATRNCTLFAANSTTMSTDPVRSGCFTYNTQRTLSR